jgi:hypothetical protein
MTIPGRAEQEEDFNGAQLPELPHFARTSMEPFLAGQELLWL